MRTPLQITRDHAVRELVGAIRQTVQAAAQLRLRALLAVAQGEHVPRVAQLLHVAQRAVRHWVHRYNRNGLEGLRDRRGGRRCRLSPEQLERVRARLTAEPRPEDQVCSLRGVDIRRILREEFQTQYARSSVYYFLHRTLDMSYVKPRPLHRKTDPSAQAAFKKTSPKGWRKSEPNIRTGGWRSGSRTKAASGSKGR
jgi:transposase